mmetsp:Transcript_8613/g.12719  ORF Transcript_8613/g.12719 Transcript_8613/m.12719 type:complete len:181 (-) Transcript_8613:382-924(-)
MMKQSISIAAALFLAIFTLTNSFSTAPSVKYATTPSFKSRPTSKAVACPLFRAQMTEQKQPPLYMSETNVEQEDDKSSSGSLDNSNGFLVALMMGPPLIAKFLIVLCVKFVTDVVVFPLLYLYRAAKRLKVAMFGGYKKGSSSGLTEEEDMETTIKIIMEDKWGLRRDRFFRWFKGPFRK